MNARRSINSKIGAAWHLIGEALRGSDHDFTAGPYHRAIILLAIPMMLEMSMESVFAIVDIFFVSKLGADAVATLGMTEAVITLLYAVAIGLSMGVTALVARRVGERDIDGARRVAAQALLVGFALTLVISFAGWLYAAEILRLMGASAAVVAEYSSYTAIMFGGCGSILFLFLLNGVFRGAGDASIAMRVLWLANGVNILLDPCLIFGLGPFPELGLAGAAIATTSGRSIAVALQLYYLFNGSTRIALRLSDLKPAPTQIQQIVHVSMGGILQFFIATSSWVFLVKIIAGYGSIAVAGYTIAIRLVDFIILPAWGLSNAAATLVGQNLGAKKPQRAQRFVWIVCAYNCTFMTAVAVIFLLFPHALIGLFTDDAEVAVHAVSCLRWLSYGFTLFAIGLVMNQAFNGAGDTYTPTKINFFAFWLTQIPLAYYLAHHLLRSPDGVFIAILVGESVMTIITIVVFMRGSWMKTVV